MILNYNRYHAIIEVEEHANLNEDDSYEMYNAKNPLFSTLFSKVRKFTKSLQLKLQNQT